MLDSALLTLDTDAEIIDMLKVDYLFDLRGGAGLPLASQPPHLGLIHPGICNNVQTNVMHKSRPSKMPCMMHGVHEINKQTKRGYNKAI